MKCYWDCDKLLSLNLKTLYKDDYKGFVFYEVIYYHTFIVSCLAFLVQQTSSFIVYGIMKYMKSIVNEVQIEVYRDN